MDTKRIFFRILKEVTSGACLKNTNKTTFKDSTATLRTSIQTFTTLAKVQILTKQHRLDEPFYPIGEDVGFVITQLYSL